MHVKLPQLKWIDVDALEEYYDTGSNCIGTVDSTNPLAVDAMVFNWLLSTRENNIDRLKMRLHYANTQLETLSRHTRRCTYIAIASTALSTIAIVTSIATIWTCRQKQPPM
jgi:hypothetical protein